MNGTRLLMHAPGAPGLRLLGLGPGLRPTRGLYKLQRLLNQHAFWAQGRSLSQLRRMLAGRAAVASPWRGNPPGGFARARRGGAFPPVLWGVVSPEDGHGRGLGRQLFEALLQHPSLQGVERIYLMTTNCEGFYTQLNFLRTQGQTLTLKEPSG